MEKKLRQMKFIRFLTEKIKIEKVLILKILVEVKRTMVETIARMYPHHFV